MQNIAGSLFPPPEGGEGSRSLTLLPHHPTQLMKTFWSLQHNQQTNSVFTAFNPYWYSNSTCGSWVRDQRGTSVVVSLSLSNSDRSLLMVISSLLTPLGGFYGEQLFKGVRGKFCSRTQGWLEIGVKTKIHYNLSFKKVLSNEGCWGMEMVFLSPFLLPGSSHNYFLCIFVP